MPRAREYKNNAERQAAYRARHPELQLPRQGYLAALVRTLDGEVREAVRAECSPWPKELVGRNEEETLRNLIRYLRAHGPGGAEPQGKEGSPEEQ